MLRIESHLFKRCIFYSTERSSEHHQDEYILQPTDKLILRREGRKFLKVAILGLPNVGKSTLINQLVHRSICPTSCKVHTTIHKVEAVYSQDDTQIVFMDTPGLTTASERKKYNLVETFQKDPQVSVSQADVIGIIQDVTNVYTRHKIADCIVQYLKSKRSDTPLLLIFNKVDKLKKKNVLLELANSLANIEDGPKFEDIFMISALNGDGIKDLRNYLLDSAKEGDWEYEEDSYTDQPATGIIEQTVRAALMDHLPQEVPYEIKIQMEHFDVNEDGSINTVIRLECDRSRLMKHLLRLKGSKLKLIALSAEQRLQHAYRTRVQVLLSVIRKLKS